SAVSKLSTLSLHDALPICESFGPWVMGHDEQVIPWVTSVNIACGFHAGDPGTMRQTVALALKHGVKLGAHPGLPDLAGFGRRVRSEEHTSELQSRENLVCR